MRVYARRMAGRLRGMAASLFLLGGVPACSATHTPVGNGPLDAPEQAGSDPGEGSAGSSVAAMAGTLASDNAGSAAAGATDSAGASGNTSGGAGTAGGSAGAAG